MKFSRSKKGFSLVELLVVMAIMITLGGVGYQAMSGHKVTARDTARKESLANLQEALNAYYSKNNFYPQPALRYAVDGTVSPTDADGSIDVDPLDVKVKNIWGFRPDKEALPSCKLVWDGANNTIATAAADDFACGGVIKDRSDAVVVGWKGTLTEFSGKNSAAKKKDNTGAYSTYMNPISDRDSIVAQFDKAYFDIIPVDPTFGTADVFKQFGFGNIIYSAYRKGIDITNNKNTDVGASQYQLAATIENGEEPTGLTAYVIGNYVRGAQPYMTKIGTGTAITEIPTYLPYSLIGSKNMVIMNEQKIGEIPAEETCPAEDSYSKNGGTAPCSIDTFTHDEVPTFDGTDATSGYMGVPYPVIF